MASDSLPRLTPARAAGGVLALLSLLAVAAFTLSDRLPRLITRLQRRSELIDSISVPGDAYTFGHLVVWAGISFVVALVVRGAIGRIAAAAVLFTVSFGLEFAQQVLTTTRVAEFRDLQANMIGIVLGTVAGAMIAGLHRLADAQRPA